MFIKKKKMDILTPPLPTQQHQQHEQQKQSRQTVAQNGIQQAQGRHGILQQSGHQSMVIPTSETGGGQINESAVTNANNDTVMCRTKQNIKLKPRNNNIKVQYINNNKPK